MDWYINDLASLRRRWSGKVAETGFTFQRCIALWHLTRLLHSEDGLVAVRYEGAQDVDLNYADGRQVYVQVKYRPNHRFSIHDLGDSLRAFALDLIEAGLNEGLRFEFIAAGHSSDELHSLCSGNPIQKIIQRLTSELDKISAQIASTGLSLQDFVKEFLQRLTVRISAWPIEFDQWPSYAFSALTLARIGIASDKIETSLALLEAKLSREAAPFSLSTIVTLLQSVLPDDVPTPGGRMLRVPTLLDKAVLAPSEIQHYWEGGIATWRILDAAADVRRPVESDIKKLLLDPARIGSSIVIRGTPGSGKSSLARRVIFDLWKENHTVVELVTPDDREAWEGARRFAACRKQAVILLVEDAFREAVSRRYIADFPALQPNLVVLATSRSGEYQPSPSAMAPHTIGLSDISDAEIEEASSLSRKILPGCVGAISQKDRHQIRQSGNMLLLMILIKGSGSLEEFAQSILHRLADDPVVHDAYKLLCVATARDISVPGTILRRLDERFAGLAHRVLAEGLIHNARAHDRLRAGHAMVANAVLNQIEGKDPIALLVARLLRAVDYKDERERRFAITLLTLTDREASSLMIELEESLKDAASNSEKYGDLADLHRLIALLRKNCFEDTAKQLYRQMRSRPIRTAIDAVIYLDELTSDEDMIEGMPRLLEFYRSTGERYGRRSLLNRYSRRTLPGDIRSRMFDVADDLFSKDPPTQKEAVAWLALAQQADSQELLLKATSAASAMAREFPDSMAILRAACRVINNAPYSMCVETILKITLQFLERRIDFQDREGQFHLFTAIIRHLFVFGEASDHDRFLALTIDRGMHLFATGQTTRILRRVFFHTGRDGGKKLLDVMANIDRAESDSQYSRLRKHIEGQNPEE